MLINFRSDQLDQFCTLKTPLNITSSMERLALGGKIVGETTYFSNEALSFKENHKDV